MIKTTFNLGMPQKWLPHKLILVMKITIFFLFATILSVHAELLAQKITLTENNVPLETVLKKIRTQSGYDFVGSTGLIKSGNRVSIRVKDVPLEEALRICFYNQPLSYVVELGTILITRNPKSILGQLIDKIQVLEIEGTVLDELGNTLPGATIRVKGSSRSAITNNDGKFTIAVERDEVLQVNYIGFEQQEIVVSDVKKLSIVLKASLSALNEVSVTALGIKREKKSLGYAVQEIKGEVFEKVKEPNIISSLTGQVAGLTVYNKTGTFQAPTFNIRGASSILVVIDGIPRGTDTWAINPDDVEKIDVIKGATGAALYGAQGSNGVIMITTKKGGNNPQGLSINVNSSTVFNAGYVAGPEYQNEYGNGFNGQYSPDQPYVSLWGPKLNQPDPTTASGFVEYVQWNSPTDLVTGNKIPLPWIRRNKNPVDEIMENGYTLNNSVSLGGNNELGDFRVGYNDIFRRGNTPNTNLSNKTFDLSGGYNFKKLKIDAKISYNNLSSDNYEDVGYNWDNYILHIGNGLGANVDIEDLRNYWVEGKEGLEQRTWVKGRNNPFWLFNEKTRVYNRDVFSGWLRGNYQFSPDLNFMARISQVYSAVQTELKENKGNLAITSNLDGSYSNSSSRSIDMNADWLLRYNKRHFNGLFGFDFLVGGNARVQNGSSLSAAAESLILPDFYNLTNKTDFNTAANNGSKKLINSLYSTLNIDYRSQIYLALTGRNDWSSALKSPFNSYFYPSVSLSAVVSEMVTMPKLISFLKLRASWATGRNDVAAYWNDMVYTIGSFNGTPTATYAANLFAEELRPDRTESAEIGLDLRLFGNRIGFDVAYFTKKNLDQISVTQISSASGHTGKRENGAGLITKGFEYTISGSPIKLNEFSWNTTINLSYYKQYVYELAPGQTRYGEFYRVGERINRTRGWEFVTNDEGKTIYENGLPLITTVTGPVRTGTYSEPKLVYGFINNFRFQNWNLNVTIDGRIGGVIYNYMYANMMVDGAAPQTAVDGLRERPFIGTGVKVIGGEVLRDVRGNIVYDSRIYAANDVSVSYYDWAQRTYKNNYSVNAFDASYLKIREISLGYRIPERWIKKTALKGASVSLVGRNVFLFTNVLYTDPDVGNDDAAQGPSFRNIGFNLNVNF
jgi:TonB-linked SusC/RagA family outer membrane protein